MKTPAIVFCALCFVFASTVPCDAQAAESAKTGAAADNHSAFTIYWHRSVPHELTELANQAQIIEREVKKGNVPPEQLSGLHSRIEYIVRRAPPLITVRSKGGPLSGFITAASKLKEISFTLINAADPADLETPIAPFELSNANWGTVINVLGTFLRSRGLELRVVGGDDPNFAEASTIVCVLNHTEESRVAGHRAQQSEFESLQLGEHIDDAQTIEVIVDAIRAAWELDPARDPAALRLRFHPATKLLLVSGPAPASLVVRQVIGGLQKKTVQR